MTRVAAALASVVVLCTGMSADAPRIFSSDSTVAFTLEAPLGDLFAAAAADPDAAVAGRIAYADPDGRTMVLRGVRVSVRGHTSRSESECPFSEAGAALRRRPAARFALRPAVRAEDRHALRRSAGDRLTRNNRLPNERSPHREAFVYRVLDVLGIPTLKARPARVGGSRSIDEPNSARRGRCWRPPTRSRSRSGRRSPVISTGA